MYVVATRQCILYIGDCESARINRLYGRKEEAEPNDSLNYTKMEK